MSKKIRKKIPKESAGARSAGKTADNSASGQAAATLSEGDKAPRFSLPRAGGGTISSADFAGGNLVLFFYPRAGTPGCTVEAADFSRMAGKFEAARTAVLGVSADPVKRIQTFQEKNLLEIPLATDELHKTLMAYGVWEKKSMYGKVFDGIVRSTFLIGPTGRILKIWRKVKVAGHADEVLAAARAADAG